MNHDQINELVRKANPVPDPSRLGTTPPPSYERDTVQTRTPSGRQRRPRGILVGLAAVAAVFLIGIALNFQRGPGDIAGPDTTLSTPTTTTSTTSTTVPLPEFPSERTDLVQGGDTWAVVLAAAPDMGDPEIEAARTAAVTAGFTPGISDCDAGAAAVLGMTEPGVHYYTVSVYLNSEADAEAALAAFVARGTEGAVGLIQTFCLD